MGAGLLYGLIFLLIFFVTAVFIFIYALKIESKIGLTISSIMMLIVVLFFLTNNIDELTISKKDVVSDLKNIKIVLCDDFKIIQNKVEGMPERIQYTDLLISQKDKERIINIIKNSKNFKSYSNANEIIEDENNYKLDLDEQIFNYKYPEFYSREIYSEIEDYPTRIILSINAKSNKISYQRIED